MVYNKVYSMLYNVTYFLEMVFAMSILEGWEILEGWTSETFLWIHTEENV